MVEIIKYSYAFVNSFDPVYASALDARMVEKGLVNEDNIPIGSSEYYGCRYQRIKSCRKKIGVMTG